MEVSYGICAFWAGLNLNIKPEYLSQVVEYLSLVVEYLMLRAAGVLGRALERSTANARARALFHSSGVTMKAPASLEGVYDFTYAGGSFDVHLRPGRERERATERERERREKRGGGEGGRERASERERERESTNAETHTQKVPHTKIYRYIQQHTRASYACACSSLHIHRRAFFRAKIPGTSNLGPH